MLRNWYILLNNNTVTLNRKTTNDADNNVVFAINEMLFVYEFMNEMIDRNNYLVSDKAYLSYHLMLLNIISLIIKWLQLVNQLSLITKQLKHTQKKRFFWMNIVTWIIKIWSRWNFINLLLEFKKYDLFTWNSSSFIK